jgi:hypothetical protein
MAGNDGSMTQTIAIIANGVLMAALVVALTHVMRIPFRLERHVDVVEPPADLELERAA